MHVLVWPEAKFQQFREQLLDAKRPAPHPAPGVYLLFRSDEIVFVGYSRTDCYGRITMAMQDPTKKFDSYVIWRMCDEEEPLEEITALFIMHYHPEYNEGVVPGNTIVASCRELARRLPSGIGPSGVKKVLRRSGVQVHGQLTDLRKAGPVLRREFGWSPPWASPSDRIDDDFDQLFGS